MTDDIAIAEIRDHLAGARDALGHVRMSTPAAQLITAGGRRRRIRRAAAPAAAGAALASLGLALGLAGSPQVAPATSSPAVHVNLDAWSVNTGRHGAVTVTVRELAHPALLRRTLARAGVPALVAFRESCGSVAQTVALNSSHVSTSTTGKLVIRSADIPAGAKIVISILPTDNVRGARVYPALNFGLLGAGQTPHCAPVGTLHVQAAP